MKKNLLLIILCVMLCGCNTISKNDEIKSLMQEKNFIIVDVRTKEEYEISHIEGAINIPYDEINKKTTLDKEKFVFVYCKSGTRSNIAFNSLKELGYDVYDMGAFDSLELPKE